MEAITTMGKTVIERDGVYILNPVVSDLLIKLEEAKKAVDADLKALKEAILDGMRDAGVIKLETDEVAITYVQSTDVEFFDKAKFKKEHPYTYDEYITMKPKAGYIKVTTKPKAEYRLTVQEVE